jgi:hypothetical protein
VGASLLRNSLGWETSRTHDRCRSCQRHRVQPSRCIERSRSSEAARNHQPITTLRRQAEDVWSTLPGLYRERIEDRPNRISTSKSVSYSRDLRATSDQSHHSTLGEIGTLGCGIERCRSMVSRAPQRECSEEGETSSRPDDRQDSPHHEPGLQTRSAMQFPPSPTGRQSHELGEPTNHERLPGDSHDAQASVRGSSEYSRAKAHVDSEPLLCGYQNCWA